MLVKDKDMEQDATIIGIAATAVTGAFGFLMKSINNCGKQQQALELHLAEHHMTKDEVKEFIELTNQPIK